jgi:hypothetical protein
VRHALSLLAGALLLVTYSQLCRAAELESPPAGRQVELIVGATTGGADPLESSVREMLRAKGLAVVTRREQSVTAQDVAAAIAPPHEATPSMARILIDLTVSGQATLFLIDPRRGRVFVRRMALASGMDAVARASVRFVVERSIDAILQGRDIGVSREEFQRGVLPPASAAAPATETPPPPPLAPPAPVTPAPNGPRWLMAAGYEAVAMGSGQVQQAAKIWGSARFASVLVAGAARLAAPLSVAGDGAGARLATGGASVSVAARLLSHEELSLAAGLGVGLDLVRVEPSVTSPGLQPEAAFWAASPSVQPFAALERTFGRLSVQVLVGAELHPLAERYTVRNGSETSDVFVPWRLRPSGALLVGVSF